MLIASRAFVIQVDTTSNLTGGSFAGRVDHIVSGEATRFSHLDDLLAFMKSMLEVGEASSADDTRNG